MEEAVLLGNIGTEGKRERDLSIFRRDQLYSDVRERTLAGKAAADTLYGVVHGRGLAARSLFLNAAALQWRHESGVAG